MAELARIPVHEVMQKQVISVQASRNLREFVDSVTAHHRHNAFPVYEDHQILGVISLWSLSKVPPQKWSQTTVRELTDRRVMKVPPDCDVMEALSLLMNQSGQHMLLVTSPTTGKLEGVLTKSDILSALRARGANGGSGHSK